MPGTGLRTWFVGLAALSVLLSACSQAQRSYPLQNIPVLDSNNLLWEQLQGKAVFINYWAEWCKPCRDEIPELNQFAERHSAKAIVLSVNFDGVSGDELRTLVKKMAVEFPTLLRDPRIELKVEASGGLPETIVLDQSGNVFKVLVGPQTETSLIAVLAELGL